MGFKSGVKREQSQGFTGPSTYEGPDADLLGTMGHGSTIHTHRHSPQQQAENQKTAVVGVGFGR